MKQWRSKGRGAAHSAIGSGAAQELCAPYLPVESRADWSIQETLAVLAARQEYGQRRERDKIFGDSIFENPAWDLLLDLFVMASEGKAVSMPYACSVTRASPETTAKQIAHMEESGLIRRVPHPTDPDCYYLELSDEAYRDMLHYFNLARKSYFEPHG